MKHSSRRQFLLSAATLGAGAFSVACLSSPSPRRHVVRRSLPMMGTLAEIAVVTGPGLTFDAAEAAIGVAFDELRRTEMLMSRFNANSDVGRANRAAGTSTIVDQRTLFVAGQAQRWSEATGGRFDACLGSLEELWNVAQREVPPTAAHIAAARVPGAWRSLQLSSVSLTLTQGAKLDFGGIAKGFGIDEARRALEEAGATSALVNVGGDLFALGTSEDGDPWKVGVRDPQDPVRLITTLEVENAAVATSGDYERFFDFEGRRYHHILAPDGRPVFSPGRHSLTITAPDCLTADAAATAAFGLGQTEAQAIIARLAPKACVSA